MTEPRFAHCDCPHPEGTHRISYTIWGADDNPKTLFCVHGLTRHSRDFDDLARNLSDSYRVICPDVAGRGDSEWLPSANYYQYPQYVADMLCLLQHLGVQQLDWVGTSMGGLIGLLLAAQENTPIKHLILNDIGPFVPKEALQRIASYLSVADTIFSDLASAEQHFRQIHAPFGQLSDAQWQHLTRHSLRQLADGRYRLAYDPKISEVFLPVEEISDVDLWTFWDHLQCPVKVICGAQSDLLRPETLHEMQQRQTSLKTHIVADAGHAPALMDGTQIQCIRSWLLDTI